MNYYIKRPAADRHIYSIYTQVLKPDGTTSNHTLKLPELDALNADFLAGIVTRQQMEKFVTSIKNKLSNKQDIPLNIDNAEQLERFFIEYFRSRPFIIDKQATINKYKRAINVLGELSIRECTQAQATDKLLAVKPSTVQAEAAHKLNTLFRWSGRLIKLPIAKPVSSALNFITESELQKVTMALEPTIAAAVIASFYSGVQVGELLASKDNKLNKHVIRVSWQVDKLGKKRLPQGNKKREAFIHEKGIKAYNQFANRPDEPEITRHMLNKLFKAGCYKSLRRKNLIWADLRHSYAIFLASQGVDFGLIAKSIGLSRQVCELRYSEYSSQPSSVSDISKMITTK